MNIVYLIFHLFYFIASAHVEVSPIMHLILKLITCSLSSKDSIECEIALKALSAVLITIYGHAPQKVISYLQVCKPALELIFTSKAEALYKEVCISVLFFIFYIHFIFIVIYGYLQTL